MISLVILALVFILWAAVMFRTLWLLSKRADERLKSSGGGYFKWVALSLGTYRELLTSDKDRPARQRILMLTLLLILVIAFRYFLLTREI